MKELLDKYRTLNVSKSLEEEQKELYEYVYLTNKLEGNKLTLAQTTQLLSSATISGKNISTHDILEQKGVFKALKRMLFAVKNNEPLTLNLAIELNALTLSSLWKDDFFYMDAKSQGQDIGQFKKTNNIISITKGGVEIERVIPLSSPDNVEQNMKDLFERVNQSKLSVIDKSILLAKQIWIHQPFIDGNKRIGRLLINFITMKEGFPLFSFKGSSKGNYNSLLIQEYTDKKGNLLIDYISERLKTTMQEKINSYTKAKKANKNFGLGL